MNRKDHRVNLRDAIATVLWDQRESVDATDQADAILALPEMQARERVIEAARAHAEHGDYHTRAALDAAMAGLDALEGR